MHLFSRLVILAALIMGGILLWDLSQERVVYPGKKLIVFADMFGPGEPMQVLYGGPAPAMVSPQPFAHEHADNYRALAGAWPQFADKLRSDYQAVHARPHPPALPPADPDKFGQLVEDYRSLSAAYVEKLVGALGQSERANRLRLFYAFAEAHPKFDANMVLTFERLHPAYRVGLFEDFERRHPDYKVLPRWDGRWVLSANRPRFLTGSDVPDLITGASSELRILMRENLALPLDRALPQAAKESWRQLGVLKGENAYNARTEFSDREPSFESQIYDWALERSKYQVTEEDVRDSGNPFPVGERVLYFLPRQVHTFIVFYNKAHFRLIGRDPNDPPKTVEAAPVVKAPRAEAASSVLEPVGAGAVSCRGPKIEP